MEAFSMEDMLRPLYQERAGHKETSGILLVEKNKPISPLTDNFDAVLLVIVRAPERVMRVKHYEFEGKKAALYMIDEKQIHEWLLLGGGHRIVEWVLKGTVLFDRNEYISNVREGLNDFPAKDRKMRITIEFARLIRRFYNGKELFESRDYLDAFNDIMHALHHLARLAVIEQGFHPETTVWKQVKQIEPEIFKLYSELVTGDEPLDKRIELLLLAGEFSLISKTRKASDHLLAIIAKKEEGWSFGELLTHEEISEYAFELSALIEHLIQNSFIDVVLEETKGKGIHHRLYKVNPQK
jgi:ribosomal protein L3